MLQAPLEQFQILQILPINFFIFDCSITNFLLINLLSILCFVNLIRYNGYGNHLQSYFFFIIPNCWQKSVEFVIEITIKLLTDTIPTKNQQYFIIISILFNFILFSNLVGLIPYSFTATSHLIITFIFSFSIFIAVNVITFSKYKIESFNLFLPSNTGIFLALLLVPIEFISYIAKPISLGVRLFINLMAGHSLLKVIIGFSWSMLMLESKASIGLLFPVIVLIVLFALELGVALIQTYVFIILTCIYIQESQ